MAGGSAALVFDWNARAPHEPGAAKPVTLLDETLRDGLQSPGVRQPSIGDKLEILHRMDDLGIHGATLGHPSSSARAFDDVLRLVEEVRDCRMKIRVACAGRTVAGDITPMIEIAQRTGVPVEVCAFIGSSPIRQYVEELELSLLVRRSTEAIDLAVKAGLSVTYVTEDTTRSHPEVLATLFRAAIDRGASRLCLADTVGHATADGVRSLVQFTRGVIAEAGAMHVGVDWHGHNDRGLALANTLCAIESGVDRAHGTALGIGERVGNAPIELLLVNLMLLGRLGDQDLARLPEYCAAVARATGWRVPGNQPVVGQDAFRTATGVHAAAMIKAMAKGDAWLVDRIYSGVPAAALGRRQEIRVGFMSGSSNVRHWLRERSIPVHDELVREVLRVAKSQSSVMTDDEVLAVVERVRAG
jgi:2-isopropylmalate synthase